MNNPRHFKVRYRSGHVIEVPMNVNKAITISQLGLGNSFVALEDRTSNPPRRVPVDIDNPDQTDPLFRLKPNITYDIIIRDSKGDKSSKSRSGSGSGHGSGKKDSKSPTHIGSRSVNLSSKKDKPQKNKKVQAISSNDEEDLRTYHRGLGSCKIGESSSNIIKPQEQEKRLSDGAKVKIRQDPLKTPPNRESPKRTINKSSSEKVVMFQDAEAGIQISVSSLFSRGVLVECSLPSKTMEVASLVFTQLSGLKFEVEVMIAGFGAGQFRLDPLSQKKQETLTVDQFTFNIQKLLEFLETRWL